MKKNKHKMDSKTFWELVIPWARHWELKEIEANAIRQRIKLGDIS